jgi:WD40-like Beta Propeller Repeat
MDEPHSISTDSFRSGGIGMLLWALVGCPQLDEDDFHTSAVVADGGSGNPNTGGQAGMRVDASGAGHGGAGHGTAGAGGTAGMRSGAGGAGNGDDPDDAGETHCPDCACRLGDFSMPTELRGLGVSAQLWAPSLSSDGQLLAFSFDQDGTENIYFARRVAGEVFSPATDTELSLVNTVANEGTSFLSFDGLSLYFYSIRDEVGERDLYVARRPDATSPFADTELVAGVNSPQRDHFPWLSPDELRLYFTSSRSGGTHIWRAARTTRAATFGPPESVVELSSAGSEARTALSADELHVVFRSDRDGGPGHGDLWMSSRASVDGSFETPSLVPNVNSPEDDAEPALSADGLELIFSSDRVGNWHRLYRATRECL